MPRKTMSDLSTQIETLYRVIGQIRPDYDVADVSGSGPDAQRDLQLERSIPHLATQQGASLARLVASRPTGRAASVRLTFKLYCLWFSLPLSVWFASGWIGLFFYWRALSGTARLLDLYARIVPFSRMAVFTRKPADARRGLNPGPQTVAESCQGGA
jgi:hypothetical protein